MLISVIVPTFNRARLLATTIPALAAQQVRDGVQYEVIFVNNGDSDNTEEVIAAAIKHYPGVFRYFRNKPSGGGAAPRNVGMREARGEILLNIDDDVCPDPDLVLRHAEFHMGHPDPRDAAVGEAYVPARIRHDPVSLFHEYPYDTIRGRDVVPYDYFWSCNVSVKRDFMLEHGMFDERFLFNEDVILGHKLDRAGMRLHFVEAARGEHLHQLTLAGLRAKAEYAGGWIYATVRVIPERAVMERYGVLAPELGWRLYAKRLLKRIAFRIVDNPLTHLVLRALGAENGKRSRWSDMHYGLLHRRWVVAGYHKARREAGGGLPASLCRAASTGERERGDKQGVS
jgi:glycosyltransferase involved in cell wall biosynthesis